MTGHARLSASAAHRWMHCPGSIKLSEGLPNPPTIHSATGTCAHDIAAKCLTDNVMPADFLDHKFTVDGFEIICDQEMVDAINLYLSEIESDAQPGDESWVEMPLLKALQELDPDFGGTADYVRYRPSTKHLRVTDYKYGKGTYVKVEDNEQLMKYAVGALLEVDRPVEEVEVVIVQPRFDKAAKVRPWKFRAVDLLDFVADLQAAAKLTRTDNAPLKTGNWCKFCPAARLPCPQRVKEGKHKPKISIEDFDVIDGTPTAQ